MFMMKTLPVVIAAVLAISAPASLLAAEYTTVSQTAKLAVELDFTPPTGYYEFDGSTLSWRVPGNKDTQYMRVRLLDTLSSTSLAGSSVTVVFTTDKGKAIGTSTTLSETWDQQDPHYGGNINIPDEQTSGNVLIKAQPAKGRRLGRDVGDFFTKDVTVIFTGVDFTPVSVPQPETLTTGPQKVEWPEGRRPYATPTPYPGSASH